MSMMLPSELLTMTQLELPVADDPAPVPAEPLAPLVPPHRIVVPPPPEPPPFSMSCIATAKPARFTGSKFQGDLPINGSSARAMPAANVVAVRQIINPVATFFIA